MLPRHESHTTVPGPVTVTTKDNARLTIEDATHCTVSVVNHSVGSDGIKHEEVSEGKFIVLKHGLNYVDHQPSSVWIELCPLVDPGDPNVWHGGWLEGHKITSDDKEHARLALEIAQELAGLQSYGSIKLTEAQRNLLDALRASQKA